MPGRSRLVDEDRFGHELLDDPATQLATDCVPAVRREMAPARPSTDVGHPLLEPRQRDRSPTDRGDDSGVGAAWSALDPADGDALDEEPLGEDEARGRSAGRRASTPPSAGCRRRRARSCRTRGRPRAGTSSCPGGRAAAAGTRSTRRPRRRSRRRRRPAWPAAGSPSRRSGSRSRRRPSPPRTARFGMPSMNWRIRKM